MLDRRAQISEAVVFWIFYIALTVAVIFFIVQAPSSVFSQKTDTAGLENVIFTERILTKTAWQSPLTHRIYSGVLASKGLWDKKMIVDAFTTAGTPRRLAMKLTLDHDEAYFNEGLYKEAKPLSPVRYQNFIETRPVWIQDSQKFALLEIDQVYAPKPPGGFR
ncbi:MAG: hypothetical protein QXR48_00425 [Candidatus Woesearchaeota archaeon]